MSLPRSISRPVFSTRIARRAGIFLAPFYHSPWGRPADQSRPQVEAKSPPFARRRSRANQEACRSGSPWHAVPGVDQGLRNPQPNQARRDRAAFCAAFPGAGPAPPAPALGRPWLDAAAPGRQARCGRATWVLPSLIAAPINAARISSIAASESMKGRLPSSASTKPAGLRSASMRTAPRRTARGQRLFA